MVIAHRKMKTLAVLFRERKKSRRVLITDNLVAIIPFLFSSESLKKRTPTKKNEAKKYNTRQKNVSFAHEPGSTLHIRSYSHRTLFDECYLRLFNLD